MKNLLNLMEKRNINARQLQLHFGLSNSAVTKWKTRDTYPNLELLQKLAAYFEVDVSYFYSEHNEKTPDETNSADLTEREIQELMDEIGLTRERIESLDEEKKNLLVSVVNAFFDQTQKKQ